MPDSPPTPTAKKDDAQRSLYGEYSETSEYFHDPGIIWLPNGEPIPTDPEKLRLYRPLIPIQVRPPARYRRVHAAGRKKGSPPLMPQPKTSGRFEFQGGTTSIPQPVQTLDGVSCEWVVDTVFDFVENASPDYYSGGLVLGNAPYTTESNLAMDNFPSPSPSDTSLHERAPGPRRGESMSRRIDHTRADLGLPYTNGAYSENSYYPYSFTDSNLVSSGEPPLPLPLPPPPTPPPPTPPPTP
ncbi:hypothetical protein [Limnoglobus roseus]|uniref:Uncharacterized protein n=1 Tax=Limnoglobus roseus TaxID=2598579 RepID=A0A5C1AEI7_9BACT|nr:hypothetical protein [Limnoglobus roseus]QEL17150.1 hypothetical protein PX52LOC_04131 [Limnoglobus roseus]